MTAARRGRPRGFDADVALRQASDAFRDGGYASTSLDDIVRATGLNRPSLYAAFGDKKALYLTAIRTLRDDIERSFDRLEAANLTPSQSLRTVVAQSVEAYVAGPSGPRGCLAICTAAAEAVADADIREMLAEVLALIDQRTAVFFTRAGCAEPERQARLLASMLHSLSIRARSGTHREALDQLAADALALMAPE
ncbi:TetR/AcrR family transcriptional regulator [soil metagenome]